MDMQEISPDQPVASVESAGELLRQVRAETGKVIFGQETVIDLTMTTLLCGGHALLIGVPGLAKTSLVETLGSVLGLTNKRIQFTPDLLPSDILGSEVLEEGEDGRRHFRFVPGPIFTQLLMADEINRASPRTQSALLQAMQENHVSIGGVRHDVPQPFHVLATQNPIEQEGTYPLPEAQLDRFMLQVDVDYPDADAERRIMAATTGVEQPTLETVLTGEQLQAMQRLVRLMPVGEDVVEAILKVVRSARPGTDADSMTEEQLDWGPGPRASQTLMLAVRARAMMDGRFAPSLDDVVALAGPALKHRMALSPAARNDEVTVTDVIDRLVARI